MGKLLMGIVVFILALIATVILGVFIEVFWGSVFMIPFAIAAGIVLLFIIIIAKS